MDNLLSSETSSINCQFVKWHHLWTFLLQVDTLQTAIWLFNSTMLWRLVTNQPSKLFTFQKFRKNISQRKLRKMFVFYCSMPSSFTNINCKFKCQSELVAIVASHCGINIKLSLVSTLPVRDVFFRFHHSGSLRFGELLSSRFYATFTCHFTTSFIQFVSSWQFEST